MTTITFLANKGGVGKTGLSIELAAHLNKLKADTALVDIDRSLDSSSLIHQAAPEIEVVTMFQAGQGEPIPEFVEKVIPDVIQGHDFVVIDTPGNFQQEAKPIIELSDIVVIPTVAGVQETMSAISTYEYVCEVRDMNKYGRPFEVFVLFNRVDGRKMDTYYEHRELIEDKDIPVLSSFIRERSPYAIAQKERVTVIQMKTSAQTRDAKLDLSEAFQEILMRLVSKKVANG